MLNSSCQQYVYILYFLRYYGIREDIYEPTQKNATSYLFGLDA